LPVLWLKAALVLAVYNLAHASHRSNASLTLNINCWILLTLLFFFSHNFLLVYFPFSLSKFQKILFLEFGSQLFCGVMASGSRRLALQRDQSAHHLWFEISGMETHYHRFKNNHKFIKEVILNVDSFKEDFPNNQFKMTSASGSTL